MLLRANKKRGIGFEEAQTVFDGNYYLALRMDEPPEQWRATGWVNAKLYSVVYEVRQDDEGEFYWLVTLWKATEDEKKEYENTN
ncbi:MAG: BrnT family toxin [Candidatus Poribacteria bacterium]